MSLFNATESESSPPPPRADRPAPIERWAPFLIILAVLSAYCGSLRGPFVLDDVTSIHDNPTVRHLWPIWTALSPPAGKGLTPNGRPLVNLSLAVNYAIGGYQVQGYHIFNLLVHLGASLALFGILRRTLLRCGQGVASAPLALGTALLWALHPIETESVTYIVQRAESMMGLFYLVTVYAFIRAAEATAKDRLWSLLAVLSCACGMASKEVMVSAPLIAALYDRTFFSGSFREAWKRHRGLLMGLAATWVLLGYEVAITGNRGGTAGYGAHVTWWRYALTQFPAIVHYLRLCVWPHPLVFDYGMGLALQKARVVPYALGVLALLGGTGYCLVQAPKPGRLGLPAVGFAGAWFFAILAPTSSVVPVATQTMAEHRMYLPLAAVVAVVAIGGYTLVLRLRKAASPAYAGMALVTAAAIACALGIVTLRRNQDFQSNLTLWTVTAQEYPRNMRALYNLGVSLTEAGRLEEAVKDYEIVVKTQPDYVDAHHNLANSLVKLGRVEDSLVHYEIAAEAHPDSSDIQCSLGIALLDTGRVEPAITHLRKAITLEPGNSEAVYQLGEALLRAGKPAEALVQLQAALKVRPASAEVDNALGNALFQTDHGAEAAHAYREAIKLDAHSAEAHNNLGNLLLRSGQLPGAIAEFKSALESKPAFAEAHNNLGDALLESGRSAEAVAEFKASVALSPDSAEAHYNLANALAKSARPAEAAAEYQEVLLRRPAYAEAHNNLGIAFIQLDRIPEAEAQFAEAVRLNPEYSDARENLARLQAALRESP